MDFESYLDYIEEAVLVVDKSLDVISVNAAFKRLFPSVKKYHYAIPFLLSCPKLCTLVKSRRLEGDKHIQIGEQEYAIHVSEIFDDKGEAPIARSFALFDVTDYSKMLEALHENNMMLQKSNEAVEEKNAELRAQAILKEKIAARIETVNILGDLHDTLGHSLTVLNALNKLALIEKKKTDTTGRAELLETMRLARISLAELDTIDILAMSGGETTMTITTFLYRLKQTMLSVSLEVRLNITGTEDRRHSRTFYPAARIIQEATTNCLRHSDATTLWIEAGFKQDCIRLLMEDNGKTLKTGEPIEKGNGILGMERRAADCGGEIDIRVAEGGGMLLSLILPVI